MKANSKSWVPHGLGVGIAFLCLSAASVVGADASRIETAFFRFDLSPETGRYEINDKQSRVVWKSNPARFAEATLNLSGKSERVLLKRCEAKRVENGLELTFHPSAEKPEMWLRVLLRPLNDGKALEFSCAVSDGLPLESIRLLDEALWVTDTEKGYVVVPVREGLLVPADSGQAFTHRFDTYAYEGCHMAMLGVVKDGAAALVTWDDPYVVAELKSTLTNAPSAAGKQVLAPSLVLRKSARSFRVQFLGRGDYVTIAKAYREVANEKGWLVTWDEKLKGHPERAKYFGASNYKLWSTLDRRMSEDSTKEERVRVNWTFDEAAQVAEHLKRDLKLDKVLFIMGGWIHRGYDNQHPDILPTAPECGGDAAFADACRRIRALGYVLSLHDNYQDIYRDSSSWNEHYLQKNADGSLMKGGHWAGGRAYITCSQMALELARRPQNLPAVKKLSDADSYFIDTTYAAGLQECFDKEHPLTRADDMKWKQAISDYAREVFGSFGSECGREWAVPHADFFEGLTGVSGSWYHNKDLPGQLGATVVPLFELVYRDCIALYGKYGYDPAKAAEYVLHHIAIGRPLNYHIIPPRLYWKESEKTKEPTSAAKGLADSALFTRADHGWVEGLHIVDRFVKNTHEILSPLNEITARVPMTQHEFLTPDRKVQRSVFGSSGSAAAVIVNTSTNEFHYKSKFGGEVTLPPYGFVVESPTFVAFHASSWNGLHYDASVLFTLRALNGVPLDRATRVRIFHGFGDTRVKWRDSIERVDKEAVITISGTTSAAVGTAKSLSNSSARANDLAPESWPQFRGPQGSGVGATDFPTHFGPRSNVLWKLSVPSGHSSPCIWGDKIFLTGFESNKLQVLGLDRHSGRMLWRRELEPGPIERGARLSNPATATPAVDGQRVIVYFGSFGLACWDFQGAELWRKPLPVPITQHGAGTSPVIAGELVLLNCDQDVGSYLLAVDKRTGRTVWRAERPEFRRGFSTPLLWPPEKPEEIIIAGTLRLVCYSLRDGAEKWSVSGLPNEMVASPVAADDLIFVAGWTHGSGVSRMPAFDALLERGDQNRDGQLTRDEAPGGPAKQHFVYIDANKDGLVTREEYDAIASIFNRSQNIALAVRPGGTGDVTQSHVVWKHTRGLPYCPSPLHYEGRIYLIKNGGLATCLDAKTGQAFYAEERLGALGDYYASPVAAAGKICVISQPGIAVVYRAGDALEVLARNGLDEPVIGTPALAEGKLYVRTAEHLFAFGTRDVQSTAVAEALPVALRPSAP